jgi:valyl-tRNA synthetase
MTLRVLHPLIPFITEEIWTRLPRPAGAAASLMLAEYPGDGEGTALHGPWPSATVLGDGETVEARAAVELLTRLVTTVRGLRAQLKLPPNKAVEVILRSDDGAVRARLESVSDELSTLARLTGLRVVAGDADVPRESVGEVVEGVEVVLPLEGLVDLDAERKRVEKELGKLEKELTGLERKLANESFRAKAPAEVVAKDEDRLARGREDAQRLRDMLGRLS